MKESIITQVSLTGTIVLCVLGLIHCSYRQHNWFQNVGMMLIVIGCGAKLWGDPAYVPVAHVGLFMYALGTAWRVYKFRPRNSGSPPRELSREKWRQVTGGMRE